ncbi:response regulator [Caldalkalibacillus horti]|uniref:DNA-binding NarL/FixJ family response regulator n=1 Tax=Caldalkalibacillus horti TaxID=77523 RepID=A0ABT9W1G2_9BACI|nr:response regulator transcription factor [Bacillus horti]MDQ0167071.1 DNA-binding NarL/FixJ family response regulator [Bacillus horti]
MIKRFRILIADDSLHAREGIREIIEEHHDFEIVGEAKNGLEAIQLTEQLMPDLILMDINMPKLDGFEATRVIKNKFPYVKVVIITVSDEVTDLFEALKRGAQGYLLKNLHPSTWYDYLYAFAQDEVPMSKDLALKILQEFNVVEKQAPKKQSPLSQREQEVLQLVAEGSTNKEISTKLSISENTVKNHLKNIMQKLHLENRVQLTRYAYEQGWMT